MGSDTYRQYLAGPEWAAKREAVRLRTLGRCEFCGAAMRDVHHVRYPKQLGTEPTSDLLAVCGRCHNLSHGVRPMQLEIVPDARVQDIATPAGIRIAVCSSANGNIYASIPAWAEALQVPHFKAQQFESGVEAYGYRATAPGRMPVGQFNGQKVVSWQLVAESLRATDRKYHRLLEGPRRVDDELSPAQHAEMCSFLRRIDDITRWGWDVQSQALAGRLAGSAVAPASLHDQIALLARGTADHEVRINRIEATMLRLPDQPVTVAEAIAELGLDAAEMTRGRLNLEQDAGMRLKDRGAKPAGKGGRRLSGVAVDVMVNRWCRRDAYGAIGDCKGRSFDHLLADAQRLEASR